MSRSSGRLAGTDEPVVAPAGGGPPPITWTWNVERSRDPISADTMNVTAWHDDGANCGVAFGVDERWLVMGHVEEGRLQTNGCMSNLRMNGTDPERDAIIDSLVTYSVRPAGEPADGGLPDAGPGPARRCRGARRHLGRRLPARGTLMHRRFLRGIVAAGLAVGTLAAPAATVHACSCVGFSTAEAVESATIAFVGTVAERAPGGQDPMLGAPLVRYAFAVERASKATGPTVEVVSHDDPGGSSCGFSFGHGERWFVAAMAQDGVLRTSLCSGNMPVEGLGEADMAALVELLPAEPLPGEVPSGDAGLSVPAPLLVALLGVGVLAAGSAWAFRRGRAR